MTNISKKVLQSEITDKLLDQLASFFSNQNKSKISLLFSDLLTPAEQIMFIKRLAIIIMLHEGNSTYKISKYLFVSDATVRAFKLEMKNDDFVNIINHYQNKNFNAKVFWQTIEVLLRAGLPSRGNDRWKALDALK